MATTIRPVILCGGSGTRLWPLSTPKTPKQFLSLTSARSMIGETADRFVRSNEVELSFADTMVVGSQRHRSLLEQTLPGAAMILEPYGRNSAPAVAAACLACAPEDILLILPADHNIKNVPAFHAAIGKALGPAQAGDIVTFGIEPSFPATGYGYINAPEDIGAVRKVAAFVEKPPLETAEAYLAAGGYYWNAGIFMFSAVVMLDALNRYAPDIVPAVQVAMPAMENGVSALSAETFNAAPDISIDYAVMEHADNVKTVPVEMGWSDVGDYFALWQLFARDMTDNVTFGPVYTQDSSGVFARSEGPAVTIAGVSDLTVVATPDTVLVLPKGQAAVVKELGGVVNKGRAAMHVSPATRTHAKDWLWRAFDVWAEKAWDAENGGFVEQLSMAGEPDSAANRRVRVQARQIYSFARAISLGWPERDKAEALINKGLDLMNAKARHPDGGWMHILAADGTPKDERRDLYDHAFIILAGAGAYEATGSETAKVMAYEALDFLDHQMKDTVHGGWIEQLPAQDAPRRANPHMHMLEAMLALYGATGDPRALSTATDIITLFETKFFCARNDILREFFQDDWSPLPREDGDIWEPGHMYEWATLLNYYDRLADRDTQSWRRRMIRKADRDGVDRASGFAYNELTTTGRLTNANRRNWPQMERLRARMLHPETAPPGTVDAEYRALMTTYMDGMPDGTWIDQTDPNGEPNATAIPASVLYHVTTAFTPIIEALK